jgi:hypothetical protein
MSPWIGSAIVWLLAPFAGVAAINLPLFVYFLVDGRLRPAFLQHAGLAIAAVLFVAVWVSLVWWLARLHSARARQVHVVVACVLAMAGSAAAFIGGHARQAAVSVERIR